MTKVRQCSYEPYALYSRESYRDIGEDNVSQAPKQWHIFLERFGARVSLIVS